MYNIQHLVALPSDRHPREGSSGPSSLFRLNPRFGTPALAKATVLKFLKKEHSMSDSEYVCICDCWQPANFQMSTDFYQFTFMLALNLL